MEDNPDIQLTIVSKKACIICMMPYQEQLTNGQCQRTEAAQRPGSGTSRGGKRAPPSPASAPPATLYQAGAPFILPFIIPKKISMNR